ncbi:Coronin-like protein crn1 [Blastocladiella emersonii ATCC 22665]|nr:Coronin-like protein crn1 [Blastocladiella emersonii ATCC 22665]
MSRFVRQSKYRHVYGTPNKRDNCYDNVRVSSSAWDTNLVKVNPQFISLNWNTVGGGSFAVIPLAQTGKQLDSLPLFSAHAGTVLDTDFHPFNDHIVASGAEDCKVMVWKIPEGGPKEHITTPTVTLSGHQRKVGHVQFHPTAENVLTSAGADFAVKLWDIEHATERIELAGHGELIQSMTYSWTGDRLATTCKDKVLRVFDVRAKTVAQETAGHQGIKGSRAVWLGDLDKLVTTGFSRTSDRQINVWDMRNFKTPVKAMDLDSSSGILMPFYDKETQVLFLAGKGDGNIAYYEYDDANDELYPLADFKSSEPQRGIGFLPKRACNVTSNEIARAFKVHTNLVEPISFVVPRKADTFQADIFPDAPGDEPTVTAAGFFDSDPATPLPAPKLVSMEHGFKVQAKKEFTASSAANEAAASLPGSGASATDLPKEAGELAAAYKALAAENEQLKNDLVQRDLRIKQLEAQLATAHLAK